MSTRGRVLLSVLAGFTTSCALVVGLKDRELYDGGADAMPDVADAAKDVRGDVTPVDGGQDVATSDADAGPPVVTFQSALSGAAGTSPLTIANFDPGTGPNRLLVVGVSFAPNGLATPAPNVTFNAIGLTEVAAAAGTASANNNPAGYYTCTSRMFYLLTPPTGAHDIVITWKGLASPSAATAGAVAFYNVNQTTPIQNAKTASANDPSATTSMSITLTTAAGHMTLDNNCNYSASMNIVGTQTTARWKLAGPGVIGAGSTYASTGATTVAHAWTQSNAYAWVSSGIDIVPP